MNLKPPVKTFKDLIVWKKAFALCLEIYRVSRGFPLEERFGLAVELRNTARSLVYNIAEGNKRRSRADYLRFLGFAAGSGGEVESQLLLASALGYIQPEDANSLKKQYAEVERLLEALIRALKRKKKN